jgi:CRP/FNR family transcriptional regulator
VTERINVDCKNCDKRVQCCCKSCFVEDQNNVFKNLKDSELGFLIDGKQQIVYRPGETIIKQNTSSTYVICVKQGMAKVYVEGARDKNLLLKIVNKGDFITGGGLFNGNIQKFTISAISETTCCLIDSSKLTNLFSKNNQFAIDILRHHSKQNNILLSKLVNLTQKYMPGRVAETLLFLKNDIYKTNPFKLNLSRQDLADMSNMTKESFVRILQEFKSSKIITSQGSTVEILDENSLISISING